MRIKMRQNSILLLFLIIMDLYLIYGKDNNHGLDPSRSHNQFATDLYNAIAIKNLNENIVISPAAVQSSMALIYYGAKDKTANELKNGVRLESNNNNIDDLIQRYSEYQKTFTRDNHIRLINRIFINENLEYKNKFRDIAQRLFDSDIEKVDFHPPYNKRTAEHINKMIETATKNKVTNLVQADQLDDLTEGIVVNAISYSASWQKTFPVDKTTKRSFSMGNGQYSNLDTMWTLNNYLYGEINSLNSKVIELPYQNSDFVMLLILPNNKNGLNELIQRLDGKNLIDLLNGELSMEKVEIYLPKFHVQFNLNLQEPFKQLGVSTMFTRNGDFGNMYRMFVNHYLNSVNHGAHVEINENGIEQTLDVHDVTSGGFKSLFTRTKKFDANHPFIFAIKHHDSIIFMGHISN